MGNGTFTKPCGPAAWRLPWPQGAPGPNHLLHRATPFSDFVKLSDFVHGGAGWPDGARGFRAENLGCLTTTSDDKGITTG